jgi:hypothetical protein
LLLVGIGIGAIFGFKFYELSGRLLSSYQGAYLLVRGISLWFGGFINERDVFIALVTDSDLPYVTFT